MIAAFLISINTFQCRRVNETSEANNFSDSMMDSFADLVTRGSEDLIVTHPGFPDRLWLDHSAAPSNKQGRATQFKLFGLVHSHGCQAQKVC